MEIDTLLRLMRKRRSIRRFKPDPVPDEHIEKIIEAGRWAMSGANGQPWEFIVVKDKAVRDEIARLHEAATKRTYVIESTRLVELRHPNYITPPQGLPGFKDAPVLIVVCADPRTLQASGIAFHFFGGGEGGPLAAYYKNMANATMCMHLAVAALGLGSQWVSVNPNWDLELKRLLDIPDIISVQTIIPVGYPAYKSPPPYRRKLEEILHQEKYDHSKFRTEEDIREFLLKLRQRTTPAYKV